MSRAPGPLISFVLMGMLLVMVVTGIVLFSWLLLLGAATGLCLYIVSWVRQRFFARGVRRKDVSFRQSGRIIEHDDSSAPR